MNEQTTPPPDPQPTPGSEGSAPPPPVDPAAAGPIESTQDDRTMALVAHLVGGIVGFLVPLIVWLVKKDQSRFVNDQAKEALNFQLTILGGYILSIILSIIFACVTLGFGGLIAPLFPLAVFVVSVTFGIIGGMKAKEGELYRYPFAIRLIK